MIALASDIVGRECCGDEMPAPGLCGDVRDRKCYQERFQRVLADYIRNRSLHFRLRDHSDRQREASAECNRRCGAVGLAFLDDCGGAE
jgi:hypothetical protein